MRSNRRLIVLVLCLAMGWLLGSSIALAQEPLPVIAGPDLRLVGERAAGPVTHNSNTIFPEYEFKVMTPVGVSTDEYIPYEPIPFTMELTYPGAYVSFYDGAAIERGPYVTDCAHLAAEQKVRCTGQLPAADPPIIVNTYMGPHFLGKNELLGQSSVTFQFSYTDSRGSAGDNLNVPVAKPLDLTVLVDAPANAATQVKIESGGQGPLLQWHDRASDTPAGYLCGDASDRVNQDIAYMVFLRKQGAEAWQEVGAFPNCARQVQLPSTALTCTADGDPQPYEWKVIAFDIKYMPNSRVLDNTFTLDLLLNKKTDLLDHYI